MQEITRSTAIMRAKNYRNAKQGFQQSVYWAVNQALHGNADGLYLIMLHAGMLNGQGGEMTKLADGRQLWTYWNAPDGLGLDGLVQWDKSKTRFKMSAGWRQIVEGLDLGDLHVRLTTTLWSKFEKEKPEPSAFDLEAALEKLLKTAGKNGYKPDLVHARLMDMLAITPESLMPSKPVKTPDPVETPDPVDLADAVADAIEAINVVTTGKTRKTRKTAA